MRKCVAALLLLAFVPVLWAGELKIVGQTKVAPYRLVRLKAEGLELPTKADDHGDVKSRGAWRWFVDGKLPKDNKVIDVAAGNTGTAKELQFVAPPGDYKVTLSQMVTFADGYQDKEAAEVVVTVNAPGPAPIPPGPTPVPPGPTPPGPVPPTPTPTPDVPAPIPLPGLRVMVIYERMNTNSHTPANRSIFNQSQRLREYLNAKTVVTPNNPAGAWRIVDQNQWFDPAEEWAPALKLAKSVPWLVISNGKTGFSGPLPPDMDDSKLIELIKKYEVTQ